MPAKAKTAAQLKKGKTAAAGNIHAFVGTDDLSVKEAATALSRRLMPPEEAEFGLETVEGGADNSEHAERIVRSTLEALQTLPFFGGRKVVWLRGVNFLADTITGRSESTQSALASLMAVMEAGLPADVQFILSASEVDKRRAFFLGLKKVAQLEVFDLIDTSRSGWEREVAGMVGDRARELGLSFGGDAMELFVMLAGEDSRQIRNELEKLDLFLGPENRRVTMEDVRSIVSATKAGVVFELGNALGRRRLDECLHLVDELLEQQESPIGILLAAVVPKVRNLFQAKMLEERCRPSLASYQSYSAALERLPERDRAHLPKKKDGSGLNVFPLFLAAKEAAEFTSAELRRALEECLKANRRLVTSSLDPVIVLNQLLVGILAGKG
ncbi:MAG: polymerase subunit delta [Verrucomicrobiales bacterium]|nr:polymerase subunit delta [Verrucomicrobiales bacterium]